MPWYTKVLLGLAFIGVFAVGAIFMNLIIGIQGKEPTVLQTPPIINPGNTGQTASEVEFRIYVVDRFDGRAIEKVDFVIFSGNNKIEGQSGTDGYIILDLNEVTTDDIQVTLRKTGYRTVERETVALTINKGRVHTIFMDKEGDPVSRLCEGDPPDTELEVNESFREGKDIGIRFRAACPGSTVILIAAERFSTARPLSVSNNHKIDVDKSEGAVTFPGLKRGKYEVRSFHNFPGGTTITARSKFEVLAPNI